MMLDDYRKGWALRYIREARYDLRAYKKISRSHNLIIDAARKAQIALYFSLGYPPSIKNIVNELSDRINDSENPILRYLIEIELFLQKIENLKIQDRDEAISKTDEIIQTVSSITNLLASE